MIKVENEIIETEGDGMDLLSEASIALTEVTRRMSEGDCDSAVVYMFSMVKTAIEELAKQDIEIDKDKLMFLIENYPNDDDDE